MIWKTIVEPAIEKLQLIHGKIEDTVIKIIHNITKKIILTLLVLKQLKHSYWQACLKGESRGASIVSIILSYYNQWVNYFNYFLLTIFSTFTKIKW